MSSIARLPALRMHVTGCTKPVRPPVRLFATAGNALHAPHPLHPMRRPLQRPSNLNRLRRLPLDCSRRAVVFASIEAETKTSERPSGSTQSGRSLPGNGNGWSVKDVISEAVAGFSVTLVLVPQSVAYAGLAGCTALSGLYAATVAPLPAAVFASSRYLQVGPCALMSIQTLGALTSLGLQPGTALYVAYASLMSLVVSAMRLTIGVFRGGDLASRVPHQVLEGFTLASSWIIVASQLPVILGAHGHGHGFQRTLWLLTHPASWHLGAALMSVATIAILQGGRRLHPLTPGAFIAAAIGIAASLAGLDVGPTVGVIPAGLPPLIDVAALPWHALPSLLLPSLCMAVAGFIESASVSRRFAKEDGESWSGNREIVSEGVAGIAAGLAGGFPVGGSFSRSSLARAVGGRSRLTGIFSGVAAIAFLLSPAAVGLIQHLPRAVLGALVANAMFPLTRPPIPFTALGDALAGGLGALFSPSAAGAAKWGVVVLWASCALTLAVEPRMEIGLGLGLVLAFLPQALRAAAASAEGARKALSAAVVAVGGARNSR